MWAPWAFPGASALTRANASVPWLFGEAGSLDFLGSDHCVLETMTQRSSFFPGVGPVPSSASAPYRVRGQQLVDEECGLGRMRCSGPGPRAQRLQVGRLTGGGAWCGCSAGRGKGCDLWPAEARLGGTLIMQATARAWGTAGKGQFTPTGHSERGGCIERSGSW